jgi:hypothetical protein
MIEGRSAPGTRIAGCDAGVYVEKTGVLKLADLSLPESALRGAGYDRFSIAPDRGMRGCHWPASAVRTPNLARPIALGHASSQITLDFYGHHFRETSVSTMHRLTMRIRGNRNGHVVALAMGTFG